MSIGGVEGIGAPLPLNRIGDDGSFACGTEKVTDGGLENWDNNTPDDWTETGESAGVRDITDETTEVHGGSHAAKLEATDNDETSFRISQDLTLIANKYYEISCWPYFASRTVGTVWIQVYNATDESLVSRYLYSAEAAYANRLNVFKPTVAGSGIYLYLINETTTGIVYFDDISLRDVDLIARRYGGDLIGAIGMQQIDLWDKWSN